jgi:phosphoadenosine phosphosulfate reductase
VLVAFSGGKDSWCVLDMCTRVFDHVEAFFMYFLPGISTAEAELERARARYGIVIHQLPHWVTSFDLRDGSYMFPSWRLMDIEYLKLRDIYNVMIARTGIPMIATGARRGDSLWRKRNLANIAHYRDVCHPCVGWSKADVLSYLDIHKIPRPPSSGGAMTGVGLAVPEILWLHDNYPDDYAKLIKVFPFAEAVVWRRKFYGVGANAADSRKARLGGAG